MHASTSLAQFEGLTPRARPPLGLRAERVEASAGLPGQGDNERGGGAAELRAPREQEAPQAPDVVWRIPPIRWGGTMTTEVRVHKVGDERPRFAQIEYATIRG